MASGGDQRPRDRRASVTVERRNVMRKNVQALSTISVHRLGVGLCRYADFFRPLILAWAHGVCALPGSPPLRRDPQQRSRGKDIRGAPLHARSLLEILVHAFGQFHYAGLITLGRGPMRG